MGYASERQEGRKTDSQQYATIKLGAMKRLHLSTRGICVVSVAIRAIRGVRRTLRLGGKDRKIRTSSIVRRADWDAGFPSVRTGQTL